jgi:hypothetical protein
VIAADDAQVSPRRKFISDRGQEHSLGQAQRREYLALQKLDFHFKECNAGRSVYWPDAHPTQGVDSLRLETLAAA